MKTIRVTDERLKTEKRRAIRRSCYRCGDRRESCGTCLRRRAALQSEVGSQRRKRTPGRQKRRMFGRGKGKQKSYALEMPGMLRNGEESVERE